MPLVSVSFLTPCSLKALRSFITNMKHWAQHETLYSLPDSDLGSDLTTKLLLHFLESHQRSYPDLAPFALSFFSSQEGCECCSDHPKDWVSADRISWCQTTLIVGHLMTANTWISRSYSSIWVVLFQLAKLP